MNKFKLLAYLIMASIVFISINYLLFGDSRGAKNTSEIVIEVYYTDKPERMEFKHDGYMHVTSSQGTNTLSLVKKSRVPFILFSTTAPIKVVSYKETLKEKINE